MKINLILAVIATSALYNIRVSSHPVVMRNIIGRFIKPLEICQQEMELPDTIYNDFSNFWTEGYEITNNATGCALICVAAKLDLIIGGQDSRINPKICLLFIKKRGADNVIAERILFYMRQCEEMTLEEADSCVRVVRSANCFRKQIFALYRNSFTLRSSVRPFI